MHDLHVCVTGTNSDVAVHDRRDSAGSRGNSVNSTRLQGPIAPHTSQKSPRSSRISSRPSSVRIQKTPQTIMFPNQDQGSPGFESVKKGAQDEGAVAREPIKVVIPQMIHTSTRNGMTYKKGGGFAAIKQLAVASLGKRAEEDGAIQSLISTQGDSHIVRLPRSPRRKKTPELPSPPPVETEPVIVGFDGGIFQRVPSNDWLNDRTDMFEVVAANAPQLSDDALQSRPGVHFLREEEGRVASARSGAGSSRPRSSSQGERGPALDRQVHNLERRINYQLPKPLLPEVYQQVWKITSDLPGRTQTPPLRIRPPTIPIWNPASPQSPARKISYEDRVTLPLITSPGVKPKQWPFESLPHIQTRLALLQSSTVTPEVTITLIARTISICVHD